MMSHVFVLVMASVAPVLACVSHKGKSKPFHNLVNVL